ncbi:MAG: biopolymer transporter ExbD [Flavobacteriales bacterium]|nr:biopolymer transporter ExbD [Flavobacteriales bacterium]
MTTKNRTPQAINAGSMADIAFLLLVFFLVTTTVADEAGIMRKLPQESGVPPAPIPKRDVLEVLLNKDNLLMVEGNLIQISELKDITKHFLINPMNADNLPRKKTVHIEGLGERMVSKQIISVQNHVKTNYGLYVQVQDELAAAYHEVRNELALEEFHTTYDDLVVRKNLQK